MKLESVKRTAEGESVISLSRPFHGLYSSHNYDPSTEVLGYFRSSATRTHFRMSCLWPCPSLLEHIAAIKLDAVFVQ